MLLKIEGYSSTGQNVFYSVLSSSVESLTLTYMSSLILETFLLFKISFITYRKYTIQCFCKKKMHMSLCDQMVEFVNLCPLGQDRKKGSIKNKTINGVLKWPSNVSNKKEIMPAVFIQTLLRWHLRWQKTAFLAFDIWFFRAEGGGGGGKPLENISFAIYL